MNEEVEVEEVVGIDVVSSFFRHDLLHVSDMVDSMLSKHNWMIFRLLHNHFIANLLCCNTFLQDILVQLQWSCCFKCHAPFCNNITCPLSRISVIFVVNSCSYFKNEKKKNVFCLNTNSIIKLASLRTLECVFSLNYEWITEATSLLCNRHKEKISLNASEEKYYFLSYF